MASPSKAKGNRAEVKLVKYLESQGLDAKRAWGSNGRAMGEHEEVDVKSAGCRIQVKARKALPAIITSALTEHVDAAVLMEDRRVPVVVIRLDSFAKILKAHGWNF